MTSEALNYLLKSIIFDGVIIAAIVFFLALCIVGGQDGPNDPTG